MMPLEFYWGHFLRIGRARFDFFVQNVGNTFTEPSWILSLVLVYLILQPLEFLRPWRKDQRKLRPQLAIDVFYTFFNTELMWVAFGTAILSTWVLVSHDALRHYFGIRNPDLLIVELGMIPMWARLLAMYLFTDLVEYLTHWTTHRVDFLWHFHKVHHSSKQLDIWNANRFHFVEFILGGYISYFTMALVGFQVQEIFLVSLVVSIANIYSHSNINLPLGPLKYVFNNPQLHIWHHAASVDPRRNVNFGSSLAVWDYLLGTAYRPEGREHPELGFEGADAYPKGLFGQFLEPFKGIAHDAFRRVRRLRPGARRRATEAPG